MTFATRFRAIEITPLKCRQCKKDFYRWRGSSKYCISCWKIRRAKRRTKKRDRRKREGTYPVPKSQFWGRDARGRQIAEVNAQCEICKMSEKQCKEKFGCGFTRDHILPVRFIMQHDLGDPHLELNIKILCSACCGIKTQAEVMLFNGNILGFWRHLKGFGWDMEEIILVLKQYRFLSSSLEMAIRH